MVGGVAAFSTHFVAIQGYDAGGDVRYGLALTLASLVYRGSRFADEANTQPQGAGWSFNLVLFRESADRRWAWTGTLQTPLHGTVRPTLWTSLRYRMD